MLSAFLLFTSAAFAQNDQKEKPVFTYVEKMPEPGFDLPRYLSDNLHYPDSARNAGIQGRVIVRFVVNEDGHISDPKVFKSIGGGCDEEALRLVEKMPNWKSGEQNGKKVKVYYTLPLTFKLDN